MRALLVALVGAALIGCGPSDEPPSPPAPPDSIEAPADSAKEKPGKKEDAPGQEKKLDAAQACQSSLSVNGIAAAPGGRVVDVDRIPSKLELELVDCPHPTAEVRGNFVATGAGSGELHVVLLKRGALPREFQRLGSSRVVLGNEPPETSGGVAIRTDSSPALIKWITRPGGYPLPVGVATTALEAKTTITARSQAGLPGDNYKVEVQFKQYDSEIRDNGRIGTRSLIFREACSAEAIASPSRFDC